MPVGLRSTLAESDRSFAELPIHSTRKISTVTLLADAHELKVVPLNAATTQRNKRVYLAVADKKVYHVDGTSLAGKMDS